MPKASMGKRGGTKDGRRRGKKDPNAPKRSLSAYMFFAQDYRDKIRQEHPEASFGEIGRQLGAKWKSFNDKQRAPYEAKAASDKKRYEDEKAAYNASQNEESS